MIWAVLLCTTPFVLQASSTVMMEGVWTQETVCENDELRMACPPGEGIDILCANYGRNDRETCPRGNILTTDCYSKTTISTLKSHCLGRQHCSLMVNNGVFDDPCPGTFKVLTVDYTCKETSPIEKSIACENMNLNINCTSQNAVISIIDANYGRTDQFICTLGGFIFTTACFAANSLDILRSRCNGRPFCSVEASNNVFGNPCPSTYKYLEVSYSCLKGPNRGTNNELTYKPTVMHEGQNIGTMNNEIIYKPTLVHEDVNVLACHGTWSTLVCKPGHYIVITDANYGRTNVNTCGYNPATTSCYDPERALRVAKEVCADKETCRIESSTQLFGDPCINTSKYLNLTFHCESPPEQFQGLTRRVVACENDEMTLACDGFSPNWDMTGTERPVTIHILEANFGRHDNVTCYRAPVASRECYSEIDSLRIVKKQCDGKTSCSIMATAATFGDVCPTTYKYLEVRYNCMRFSVRSRLDPALMLEKTTPETRA